METSKTSEVYQRGLDMLFTRNSPWPWPDLRIHADFAWQVQERLGKKLCLAYGPCAEGVFCLIDNPKTFKDKAKIDVTESTLQDALYAAVEKLGEAEWTL